MLDPNQPLGPNQAEVGAARASDAADVARGEAQRRKDHHDRLSQPSSGSSRRSDPTRPDEHDVFAWARRAFITLMVAGVLIATAGSEVGKQLGVSEAAGHLIAAAIAAFIFVSYLVYCHRRDAAQTEREISGLGFASSKAFEAARKKRKRRLGATQMNEIAREADDLRYAATGNSGPVGIADFEHYFQYAAGQMGLDGRLVGTSGPPLHEARMNVRKRRAPLTRFVRTMTLVGLIMGVISFGWLHKADVAWALPAAAVFGLLFPLVPRLAEALCDMVPWESMHWLIMLGAKIGVWVVLVGGWLGLRVLLTLFP